MQVESATLNNARLKKRNSSLHGLKAIAIIAIILYHLDVSWLQSGHLGVIIFLVLTGYFFTKSLLKEMQDNGNIGFADRILRRIARMWPSVAVMIVGVGLLCIAFNHVLLTKMKPDVLPGLTFTLNIANVVRNTSYFDNFGSTSPLLHLWYLGIDIQFCILWPYVMYMIVVERQKSLTYTRRATFILALLSAAWMAYLYVPGEDPSRIYYSLDTRAFSPLIGACIALYPHKQLKRFNDKAPWAAPVSLLLIIIAMVFMPKGADFYYRGGMFLASILTAIAIVGLTCKGAFATALKNQWLARIGAMSLSVYLWHYPIILLLDANSNTSGILIKSLAVILSLAVGYTNYKLVELGNTFDVDNFFNGKKTSKQAYIILFASSLVFYGVAQFIPNETLIPEDAMAQSESSGTDTKTQSAEAVSEQSYVKAHSVKMDLNNLPSGKIALVEDPILANKGIKSPVMIGDSVPTATYTEFATYFPNGLLDSKVSRRPEVMQELLNSYLEQGIVGDVVILQAFNNTTVSESMLEEMIEACGDREVYLVNIKVPESIEGPINARLSDCAQRHDNVHLIDWNSLVIDHMSEYLWGDKTHLKPNGAEPYVNLIANSISYGFAKRGGYVLNEKDALDYQNKLDQINTLQSQADEILSSSATE